MGFRFNKRISILPGVRVNLGLSGASLSVGPRGASVTVGKRGIFGNVGLPGTGLSYRERLDKPSSARPRSTRRVAEERPSLPARFNARMDGDQVKFFDEAGHPIDDRLISAAKTAMGEQLTEFMEEHVSARNAAFDRLSRMHHDIPDIVATVRAGNATKPDRASFGSQGAFVEALMRWRAEMANNGPDQESLENALLQSLGQLDWPHETNIAISLRQGRLLLDVDLPEIEDMPSSQWTADRRSLQLALKPLSKQKIAFCYVEHVCSLILRLIGHSMATSTAIETVAVSAYTQRKISSGQSDDDYVATVEISRTAWDQIDRRAMDEIDPQNLLRRHGARIETNGRGIFLVQQPLQ